MKIIFYLFTIVFAILIEDRPASAYTNSDHYDGGNGDSYEYVHEYTGEDTSIYTRTETEDINNGDNVEGDVNVVEGNAVTDDEELVGVKKEVNELVNPAPGSTNSMFGNYYNTLSNLLLQNNQVTTAKVKSTTTTTFTSTQVISSVPPLTDDETDTGSTDKDGVTTRAKCKKNQFDCNPDSSMKTCIKRSLVCDRSFDCPNGKDEHNCAMPLVGYLSEWTKEACSKTCGGGMRRETRTCVRGRFYNLCQGTRTRVVDCNAKACPAIGSWGNWKEGKCSVTCGQGSKIYTRKCKKGTCKTGSSSFVSQCLKSKCKETYKWESWKNGVCSRSCGGGEREDTRTCTTGTCPGSATRLSTCNIQKCPAKWSPWVDGTCTKTCGRGQQMHKRTCLEGDCEGKSTVLSSCNIHECPAKWGPWVGGTCSKTCDEGEQVFSRTCLQGTCVGSKSYKVKCNSQVCPVTYKWGPWKEGMCTMSCGGGKRVDRRVCVQGNCPGSSTQMANCNVHDCPPKWGPWNKGNCTKTCGGGEQIVKRTCLEGKCVGKSTKMSSCNIQVCPAKWGPWNDGVCSKSCGKGQKLDRRECIEGSCAGSPTRVTPCNDHTCPVEYEWSAWVQGACSTSCGDGQRVDRRTCIKGSCPGGSTTVLSSCNMGTCPVWGPWKEGECSQTCGAGKRNDTRACVVGDCDGESVRTVFCNTNQCPLPAVYSPWKFGQCSQTCGEGLQNDVRFCIRGECDEDLTRTVICKKDCAVPAAWGRWQPGPCSVSCGMGKREYIRICNGGTDCVDVSSVFTECVEGECEDKTVPTNIWLPWSPWTACSKTCGAGFQNQTRTCDGECTGKNVWKRTCFNKHCPVPNGQWTACSKTCGWGTQMKVPFTTTADFRDCKIEDCPQETCAHPYFERYGNSSHTCCDVTPLLPGDVCGISSLQPGVGRLQGRIIGGGASRSQQWPWMVGIIVNGLPWCGGTLVDTEWVMTAAHCVVYGTNTTLPLNTIMLKFGTIDLKDTPETNAWVQESEVSEVRFENYHFPRNDIAFLRLSKPPRVTSHVQPICLPQGETLPDDAICVAAGWGRIRDGGENPSMLQEVQVRLLPDDLCALAYTRNFDRKIMKCAGRVEGGVDTCQGDSGGPLMCQRCSSCQWIAYGVVSYGDGCGLKHRPGVYAKVGAYDDWINSIMRKEISSGSHASCSSL